MAPRKSRAAVTLARDAGPANKKTAAARTLGRRRSSAKAAAARVNGQRGGRAPKFALGDRAVANDRAPFAYRGRTGTVDEIGPGKSEFGVAYTDGGAQTHGYLMSWWLDPIRK